MFRSRWNQFKEEDKNLLEYLYKTEIKDVTNKTSFFTEAEIKEMYKEVKRDCDDCLNYNHFKKLLESFKDILADENFKIYNNMIQLADDHVLFDIHVDIDPEEYWIIARQYCEDFEELTAEEIYADGRCSRHIVVENTVKNFFNFRELRELQQQLQKDFIDEINKTGVERDD